ncbi:unnamed protein product [Phyllotreta striolata]|uniref:UTP--glucose-1-phosphate uridylyltransferase n=1 Tax=Phyllotreta striolata TaxID=444603 RepID=A0A9N9TKT7_PHYSR|nr:unnamed protein product [Phyllotreta striolata]
MNTSKIEDFQRELETIIGTTSGVHQQDQKRQFLEYLKLFTRFVETKGNVIQWNKIKFLTDDMIVKYDNLEEPNTHQQEMLEKIVIVKLNGGLGTSMGCSGPKSQIVIKNKQTFLDLTIEQIKHLNSKYNTKIPLVFMNSFNTNDQTDKVLNSMRNSGIALYSFNQSCYPRISKETLMPVVKTGNVEEFHDGWYPPGHGDFYTSFWESGLLHKLIDEGKQYCFVSNVDNLGATMDLRILSLLVSDCFRCNIPEFVMELTDKTRADVKGGTLIEYDGKMCLLEIAQVPDEHVNDFKSIKFFKYFNTNNLWIDLKAIDRLVRENQLNMDIIVNNKSLATGEKVVQLETAIGAAMKFFDNGIGINVPRSRFLPVKKTSDLILIMSNIYEVQNGTLVVSSKRTFPTLPTLSLDEKYFKNVDQALKRFQSIPDMLDLDLLIVTGDVSFGKGVVLKGTVVIIANEGGKIFVPGGAVLENNIVEGDLKISNY